MAKSRALTERAGEGNGLWTRLNELEDLRQARLQKAQASTAVLFWIVIGLMMFLECLMTTESKMSLRRKVTLGGYYGCLAQWRVKWLIEHSTSHQFLWCIDSFVLQNPPLRQAPKRYMRF